MVFSLVQAEESSRVRHDRRKETIDKLTAMVCDEIDKVVEATYDHTRPDQKITVEVPKRIADTPGGAAPVWADVMQNVIRSYKAAGWEINHVGNRSVVSFGAFTLAAPNSFIHRGER